MSKGTSSRLNSQLVRQELLATTTCGEGSRRIPPETPYWYFQEPRRIVESAAMEGTGISGSALRRRGVVVDGPELRMCDWSGHISVAFLFWRGVNCQSRLRLVEDGYHVEGALPASRSTGQQGCGDLW
jgi:hypothetical protein